jgi:hypothetical protein
MASLFGRIPRPRMHCAIGSRSGKSYDLLQGEMAATMFGYCKCPVRMTMLAETGRDVACAACGATPGSGEMLWNDHQDHW